MATDLGRVKSPPPAKHDAFVAAQLARAEGRIRGLDLATGFLGLLALTAAYAVVMVLADRLLQQAPAFRQGAFLLFLAGAGAFVAVFLGRPLSRRVNPYFAARQVEADAPGAKNSVVNWLDARSQPLPAAIRGRSASGPPRTSPAPTSNRPSAAGAPAGPAGPAGVAAFVLFVLMIAFGGPRPFFSRLGHAFAPFASPSDGPATRLTLLRPQEGDAVVVLGQPVDVRRPGGGPRARPAAPTPCGSCTATRSRSLTSNTPSARRATAVGGHAPPRGRPTASGTRWPAATPKRPNTASASAPRRRSRISASPTAPRSTPRCRWRCPASGS